MPARLASSVLVTALLRLAESQGGFGAVLAKGDSTAGAILLVLVERGADPRLFERLLQPDGNYAWTESPQRPEDGAALQALIDRRRRTDPDIWVVELDIASAERFAAEMNSVG
jgi:hypothetical protein